MCLGGGKKDRSRGEMKIYSSVGGREGKREVCEKEQKREENKK